MKDDTSTDNQTDRLSSIADELEAMDLNSVCRQRLDDLAEAIRSVVNEILDDDWRRQRDEKGEGHE